MIPLNYPQNIVEGFECLDLEFPWITIEAADFLNNELNDNDNVLEIGTGGSTLFFGRRCKHIIAVETSKEWADTVETRLNDRKFLNFIYFYIYTESTLCDFLDYADFSAITVFSVDTQGGYNRSAFLNAFFKKGISPNLRMIVLDNYAHEGLFPDHWNKDIFMGEGWEVLDFLHPRWSGAGTRILIKKQ